MNSKHAAAIASVLTMLAASPVLAQGTGAGVGAGAAVNTGAVGAKMEAKLDARTAKAKERAGKEIERRIDKLTDLNSRVQAMTKISATEKSSIAGTVADEIAKLTALKAKIDADTDAATLKADIKSITDSYRIFMLVIPRGRIEVAADRLQTAIDSLTALAGKIQVRIDAAKAAGKDTSTLETKLDDMKAKIADAKIQADAAVSHVSGLMPDNGDKTKMKENEAALKLSRADLRVGHQDLQAARKAVGEILKALVAMGDVAGTAADASASTTVTQ